MSQSSLPDKAWLVYECDPGGQYLHLSRVFESEGEAEAFLEEKRYEVRLEAMIDYCMCPVYFAPENRWECCSPGWRKEAIEARSIIDTTYIDYQHGPLLERYFSLRRVNEGRAE